jgi:release factor glutamine methyltransferase
MTEGHEDLAALGKSPVLSVRDAVRLGEGLGLHRRDIAVLLGHVLHRNRAWLIAHDDHALAADESARWREAAMRRADGEPVAYIVGCKEFHGLPLRVSPAVLVPRPETEILVDLAIGAIDELSGSKRPIRLLDLGTGSGAIALACKSARRDTEVHASDASEAALAVARANAVEHGLDVEFRLGSWWEPWIGERFDLAFCNPPYVADEDPHLALLQHEPRAALVGGSSGLAALKEVVRDAAVHLVPGGQLWLEHGCDQAEAVARLLSVAGFSGIAIHRDLAGLPRCTGGVLESGSTLG